MKNGKKRNIKTCKECLLTSRLIRTCWNEADEMIDRSWRAFNPAAVSRNPLEVSGCHITLYRACNENRNGKSTFYQLFSALTQMFSHRNAKKNEAVSKFIRKFPLSPLPHTLHLNNKNIWHVAWVAVRFYNTSTQWVPSWWVKCTTGFLLLLLLLVSVCRKEQEKEEENQEDLMRPPRKFGLLKALGGHGVVAVGSGGKTRSWIKFTRRNILSRTGCVCETIDAADGFLSLTHTKRGLNQ